MRKHYDFSALFFVKGYDGRPYGGDDNRRYDCHFTWWSTKFMTICIPDEVPADDLVDVIICESLDYATQCLG